MRIFNDRVDEEEKLGGSPVVGLRWLEGLTPDGSNGTGKQWREIPRLVQALEVSFLVVKALKMFERRRRYSID
ncbi:hypothetical protein ASD65_06270 [Microbacterium sp. Root61]|uniref:hypothetical protein n=1 Tax=Microbacterium sp. Root61 TaxID=1736570 RepID=UPI0006F721BC|nr:hypothetical protein [Microbacterium sp. Root61]KRA24074.1 hypothetical protein ASD65_06270 [Microbacterium sp. Root61]